MLLIKNGTILDPYTGTDKKSDILIGSDGMIHRIAPEIPPIAGAQVLDATGCTISPGLVDVHVHFRDPGQTEKEDIFTGTAAAIAGGYTTVVCMANTRPVCDNLKTLQYVQDKAAQVPIHVLQACAITKELRGKELTDFETLHAAGAPGFTDDGINITSGKVCYEAMVKAKELGVPLSFHEEDPAYVLSPGVNYGSEAAKKFGVFGAMRTSEEEMIARDIELALLTGARVAFQHVSSGRSVALIREGKARGADIHAEATPHHLTMTEDDVLEFGVNARMNPPLRTEADRQALIAGLVDGTIDMIATDHAPHTAEQKNKPFAQSMSGITGLETAFSVLNSVLVRTGRITPMQLMRAMSQNPAQFYGLTGKEIKEGNRAELMIADWDADITYTKYKSKSSNTPFTDQPLAGKIIGIVCGTYCSVEGI
ncbi:MAG: dihydroorotase [Clostridia bacterium]|nr:dihydroorotase [Clostridia bacterium]